MSNNTITGNGSYGISVYSSSASNRPAITGNVITGNRYGIYLDYYGASEVSGNTISGNTQYGIRYSNGSNLGGAYPSITGNTITGDGSYGIYLSGSFSLATINDNNLYGNGGGYDLRNNATSEIDARFNYWGVGTTAIMDAGGNPKNISRIYDLYENSSYGFVNYSGWLTGDYVSYPAGISVSPFNGSLLLKWHTVSGIRL